MKGDDIPTDHHVLRYIKRKFVDTIGDAFSIQGGAFVSRPRDDHMASYNWLEFFDCDAQSQVDKVREHRRLKYQARDVLAKLNVGEVLTRLKTDLAEDSSLPKFAFVHDPLEPDDDFPLHDHSHALMMNMPAEEEPLAQAIGDLIAECILETYLAIKPE